MESSTFLIQKTQNINVKNNKELTPLHIVINNILHEDMEEDIEKLKLLLKSGANPNINFPDGKSPLLHVLESEYQDGYDLMCLLLDHGANPNARWENGGFTPLMWVITKNEDDSDQESKVRKLLEHSADPTEFMSKGGFSKYYNDTKYWTPLHAAIERGNIEIIKMLLESGANRTFTADIIDETGVKDTKEPFQVLCHCCGAGYVGNYEFDIISNLFWKT